MNESKKLVVVITSNANNDKSSVGFTIANAALSSQHRGLEQAKNASTLCF